VNLSAFVSVQGSVAVPATARHLSDDDVISACENRLVREGAEIITRTGRSVQFRVLYGRGMLIQWQRQFTSVLTRGTFEVIEQPG